MILLNGIYIPKVIYWLAIMLLNMNDPAYKCNLDWLVWMDSYMFITFLITMVKTAVLVYLHVLIKNVFFSGTFRTSLLRLLSFYFCILAIIWVATTLIAFWLFFVEIKYIGQFGCSLVVVLTILTLIPVFHYAYGKDTEYYLPDLICSLF